MSFTADAHALNSRAGAFDWDRRGRNSKKAIANANELRQIRRLRGARGGGKDQLKLVYQLYKRGEYDRARDIVDSRLAHIRDGRARSSNSVNELQRLLSWRAFLADTVGSSDAQAQPELVLQTEDADSDLEDQDYLVR